MMRDENMNEPKKSASRSRFAPQPNAGMRLEERDVKLLSDLFLHRLMSRSQIQTLYFGSTQRCNARLRQLFDHGFVKRFYPPAAPFGAQAIYSIGKNAVSIVAKDLEMELPEVRKQYGRSKTPTLIEHTLAIVDVRLAFLKAAQEDKDIEIERWLAEILCRHEYDIREPNGKWKKEVFKPDAFVRMYNRRKNEYSNLFIEVDLGHTSSGQFSKKMLAYQQYLKSGLFSEIYGSNHFKTIVVTTGKRRLSNLSELAINHNNILRFTTFECAHGDILGF